MTDSSSDVISIENLVKKFGDFFAVDDISFTVGKGEIFGFLGSNGSGKSTTIRMLCGILTPTSGKGRVMGCDIFTESEKIKQSIGYMSQKFSLYKELSALENIRFYLGAYNIPRQLWKERAEWVLELARLDEVKHRPAADLPPGWRQRLALACALIHKPGLVFLDEPTSGVDPLTRRHFWNFIKALAETEVTVFVTTHYMEEAMNCQRIAMINAGRIVALGSPPELIGRTFPDKPDAGLNEVFIQMMGRKKQ
jgi:ABC-2 type transport system ATP-binding protein